MLSGEASIHIAHSRALSVENISPLTILCAHLVAVEHRNLRSHGVLSCELTSVAGLWAKEHLRSTIPVQVLGWTAPMTRPYRIGRAI